MTLTQQELTEAALYHGALKRVAAFQAYALEHSRCAKCGGTGGDCKKCGGTGRLQLTAEQVNIAALLLCRPNVSLEAAMGGGKTPVSIALIWCRGAQRNLFITKPNLLHGTAQQFHEWGVHVEPLWKHRHVTALEKTLRLQHDGIPKSVWHRYEENFKPWQTVRTYERDGRVFFKWTTPQVYLTSYEFISLGGKSNALYDTWDAVYHRRIPNPDYGRDPDAPKYIQQPVVVQSIHYTAEAAAEKEDLRGARHGYGFHVTQCQNHPGVIGEFWTGFSGTPAYYKPNPKYLTAMRKAHPQCNTSHEDGFTENGFCRKCGYAAYQFMRRDTALWLNREIHVGQGAPMWAGIQRLKHIPFGTVIVDEADACNNTNSLRGAAIHSLTAKHRVVMSGTLVGSNVREIFATSRFLHGDENPLFPWGMRNTASFHSKYCTFQIVSREFLERGTFKKSQPIVTMIPETSCLNDFCRWRAPFSVIRDEDFVAAQFDLPPMTRVVVEVRMDGETEDKYRALEKVMRQAIGQCKEATARLGVASQYVWKLRDLCNGRNKIARAIEIAQQHVKAGERGVLTTGRIEYFNDITRELIARGIPFYDIGTGESETRPEQVDEFVASGVPLLVTRTDLVSTGINNLICCAFAVTLDPSSKSPKPHRQLEGRFKRPGQSKPTKMYYLLSSSRPTPSQFEIKWADDGCYRELDRRYSAAATPTVDEKSMRLLICKSWAVAALAGKARYLSVAERLRLVAQSRKSLAQQYIEETIK